MWKNVTSLSAKIRLDVISPVSRISQLQILDSIYSLIVICPFQFEQITNRGPSTMQNLQSLEVTWDQLSITFPLLRISLRVLRVHISSTSSQPEKLLKLLDYIRSSSTLYEISMTKHGPLLEIQDVDKLIEAVNSSRSNIVRFHLHSNKQRRLSNETLSIILQMIRSKRRFFDIEMHCFEISLDQISRIIAELTTSQSMISFSISCLHGLFEEDSNVFISTLSKLIRLNQSLERLALGIDIPHQHRFLIFDIFECFRKEVGRFECNMMSHDGWAICSVTETAKSLKYRDIAYMIKICRLFACSKPKPDSKPRVPFEILTLIMQFFPNDFFPHSSIVSCLLNRQTVGKIVDPVLKIGVAELRWLAQEALAKVAEDQVSR